MKTARHNFPTFLLRRNRISREQLKEAVELHRRAGIPLRQAIVRLGYATEVEVTQALAEAYGLAFMDLTGVVIPRTVIEVVPESIAREYVILPVACEQGALVIAVSDPADHDLVARLQLILNRAIGVVVATREQIIESIHRHYEDTESVESMLQELTDTDIEFTEPEATRGYEGDLYETALDQAAEIEGGVIRCCLEYIETGPVVERQTTVRYYHRMNPGKMFPLLVVLSKQKILEITQRGVSQGTSQRFQVEGASLVEVEPILPGCTCYPPREQLRVGPGEPEEARFWVVPHVLGNVNQARVVVRQNGDLLAEVPLQIRVVKQTMTLVTAALALLLPLGAALLQHFKIDFRAQAENDFSFYREAAGLLLGALSPDTLALGLLIMTGGLYLWLRPRQRDLFWDITPLGPQQRLALAREAFAGGNDQKGIRQVADLLTEEPGCQAAWLMQADREYTRGHYREALALYEKALTLGTAPGGAYARAALAAGQLGRNGRALAILKNAVEKLPPTEIRGPIWYNMGCFAARLGMLKDAVSYLGRAVDSGYVNLDKYRTDPDLLPLRSRRDFQTLLACLDS